MSSTFRRLSLPALAVTGVLALAGCAGSAPAAVESETAAPESVTVTDNHGEQTVALPPQRVVATDNRTITVLDEWGIEVVAAPLDIFPAGLSYKEDGADVINLGNHGEPDLEAVVAADPDLIINGQRFASYYGDFQTLVPDATIVELDPREGEAFDEELKRQVTVLGEIFGKQAEAEKMVADFEESIEASPPPTTAPRRSWPSSPRAARSTTPRRRADAPSGRSSTSSASRPRSRWTAPRTTRAMTSRSRRSRHPTPTGSS